MALFSEMMDELGEWKQAAGVEAGLRREFLARAEKAEASLGALVKALDELQEAEIGYRMCHDLDGDGHINTGRAWDKLRQAGKRARSILALMATPGNHGHG